MTHTYQPLTDRWRSSPIPSTTTQLNPNRWPMTLTMRPPTSIWWCLVVGCLTLLFLSSQLQLVVGQDRETLIQICDSYATQNRSINVGVLQKGETSFPFSNWRGVFEKLESSFLGRFGCQATMRLYGVNDLAGNVSAGTVDMVFTNPLQAVEFETQFKAKIFVSLTTQYLSPTNGRLPFPGATASLDRFGSIMMYAHANMTKGLGNATVPNWLVQRRASIDVFAPQTYEDVIAMLPHFPRKNLTMCIVSLTGFGGFGMINYEFTKRGVLMANNFNFIVGKSHADCIDNVLSGVADFTNIRTGILEVYVNDTRIDPGTFTVINNSPTKFFPLFLSTPLYPEWPVLAMPWVETALVQAFSVPLTALSILTNTPESLAVGGATFSYPFSYEAAENLMWDTNALGDGSCAVGWARRLPSDPFPLDPTVPHPCFACAAGTYVVTANDTSTCTPCGLNTYNEGSGQNCTACPTGLITNSVGATSSDQCVEPTKQIVAMSTSASNAILGICIACLGLLLICGLVVVALHTNPVMKAASPVFLILVLLGLGLLCASTIPRALENVNTNFQSHFNPPSAKSCDADLWLANLGYTLVTSSLLVKTWRLYSIFYSRQLTDDTAISDLNIFLVVIALMLVQCAILLGLTQSEPMVMGIHSYDAKSDLFSCSTRASSKYSLESLYLPVTIVPRFALLLTTTIAAFLVRNLPAAFNESSQLLYTMYNLSFFSILLPAIDIAVGRGKDGALIAYSVSMFLICLLTASIIFIPKFLLIYRIRTQERDRAARKARKVPPPPASMINMADVGTSMAMHATVIGADGGVMAKPPLMPIQIQIPLEPPPPAIPNHLGSPVPEPRPGGKGGSTTTSVFTPEFSHVTGPSPGAHLTDNFSPQIGFTTQVPHGHTSGCASWPTTKSATGNDTGPAVGNNSSPPNTLLATTNPLPPIEPSPESSPSSSTFARTLSVILSGVSEQESSFPPPKSTALPHDTVQQPVITPIQSPPLSSMAEQKMEDIVRSAHDAIDLTSSPESPAITSALIHPLGPNGGPTITVHLESKI